MSSLKLTDEAVQALYDIVTAVRAAVEEHGPEVRVCDVVVVHSGKGEHPDVCIPLHLSAPGLLASLERLQVEIDPPPAGALN
jgi:hypothetical protein